MSVSPDLLEAKQLLSARLLQARTLAPAAFAFSVLGHTRSVQAMAASAQRNVHAVGVGRKMVDGQATDTAAVRVYVTQKVASSMLSPADRLPSSIDGIPTDIIEAPPAFLTVSAAQLCTNDRKKRQRPVVAGISTAHVNVTAGTIGYFCRSTRPGDDPTVVYVLSNNHVFADVNHAHAGDALRQPGPMDGGMDNDLFAHLRRFVELRLGGMESNPVDAAIGELLPGVEFRPRVCRIGKIRGAAQAVEGMKVRKHGRTSGYTRGSVTDESYDALVGIDPNNPSVVALFVNQMRIERIAPYAAFGLGGDSGSLVVSLPKAEAVGLYFAGPAGGEYGVANHIADVLQALEIELL